MLNIDADVVAMGGAKGSTNAKGVPIGGPGGRGRHFFALRSRRPPDTHTYLRSRASLGRKPGARAWSTKISQCIEVITFMNTATSNVWMSCKLPLWPAQGGGTASGVAKPPWPSQSARDMDTGLSASGSRGGGSVNREDAHNTTYLG